MAIYSLHHTAIGKGTQARPHTTAAHVRYIARPQALRHFEAARCPAKPSAAMRYFRAEEDKDRVNGRVADKLMLALPRELSASERVALVREFAEAATKGRAPWLAAFHDKGKDARNPHCHLVIRDRDPKTGRRVIGTSEQGSTERFRQMWERHANQALEMAGRSERIDRRSLRAQGIERAPTIHEGPRAREMDARGAAPRSRMRGLRNGPGARSDTRQIDYRRIDRGLSRPEYNRQIRSRETETDYWNAIDADARQREFEQLGHGMEWRRQLKDQRDRHAPRLNDRSRSMPDDSAARQAKWPAQRQKSPEQPDAAQKETTRMAKSKKPKVNERQSAEDAQVVRTPPNGGQPKVSARKPTFSERLAAERAKPPAKASVRGQANNPNQSVRKADQKKQSFSERLEAERADPAARARSNEEARKRLRQRLRERDVGIERG